MIFSIFRIQDSDGGFFERFGSLLHARGENNDVIVDNAALVHPDLRRTGDAMPAESDVTFESRIQPVEDDSGNESIEYSDTEEKREEDIKKLVGMNVSVLLRSTGSYQTCV